MMSFPDLSKLDARVARNASIDASLDGCDFDTESQGVKKALVLGGILVIAGTIIAGLRMVASSGSNDSQPQEGSAASVVNM